MIITADCSLLGTTRNLTYLEDRNLKKKKHFSCLPYYKNCSYSKECFYLKNVQWINEE